MKIMLSLLLGIGFILLGVLPQGYMSFYLLKKLESQNQTKPSKNSLLMNNLQSILSKIGETLHTNGNQNNRYLSPEKVIFLVINILARLVAQLFKSYRNATKSNFYFCFRTGTSYIRISQTRFSRRSN